MEEAWQILKNCGVIIYPTETFYALGSRMDCPLALEKIMRIKGRSRSNPLPLIIGEMRQFESIVDFSRNCSEFWKDINLLTDNFWPGPLTLILPAKKGLSSLLKDADNKVAVRFTPHPLASELCRRCSSPLVSTSANPSGKAATANFDELDQAIKLSADRCVEGRAENLPKGGNPSTAILPLGNRQLKLLRNGPVEPEELRRLGFELRS